MPLNYVTQSFSDVDPPAEIVEAARKISEWADRNGYLLWKIGGACDRRYAEQFGDLVANLAREAIRLYEQEHPRQPPTGDPNKDGECSCGSGLPKVAEYDGHGCFLFYGCSACRKEKLSH